MGDETVSEPSEDRRVCVDANLWVKLFVSEEKSEQTRELFQDWMGTNVTFIAPSFLIFELMSTLRKKETLHLIQKGDWKKTLNLFYQFPVLLYQSQDFVEESWRLAQKMNETVLYDVCYLALAVKQKVPFFTADEKFYRRAKSYFSDIHLV